MLDSPQPAAPIVQDWMERHRDPRSFGLHLFGIPATILGVLLLPIYLIEMSLPIFLVALGLFLGGFAVQFLGHAIDRSEPGEIRAIRTWWAGRGRKDGAGPIGLVAFPEVEHA